MDFYKEMTVIIPFLNEGIEVEKLLKVGVMDIW
jgi:hypothetical protein